MTFLALLAAFVLIPTTGMGHHGHDTAAQSAAGGSGGGSGGTSSGSSNSSSGGSGGSGSTGTGGGGTRSPATPAPRSTPGGGPTPSRSTSPRPRTTPTRTESPSSELPPPGTVLVVAMTSLPPFLLIGCLIGHVQGADTLAHDRGLEPMHLAAQACENVHVLSARSGSGLSSSTQRRVKPKDVHLTIRIEPPPAPGQRPQIIVEPHLPNDDNKVLLTLLAALAIIVVAVAAAYVVRMRRGQGPRP